MIRSDFEVIFDRAFHRYGHRLCQADKRVVTHPIWREDNHLISGVEQRQHCISDRLLGTVRHNNILSLIRNAILFLVLGGQRLTEVLVTRYRRICKVLPIIDRFLCRLANMRGRLEVRLPKAQGDDVDALVLEFAGFRGHCQGC